MARNDALLIIDPQNDFHPGGALAVEGADEDTARLAALVAAHGDDIQQLHVTLDSHHPLHIAHAIFWVNAAGEHPAPFTIISAEDVASGVWRPALPEHQAHCESYTRALAEGGRYALCIWPTHCLVGSPGHNVKAALAEACNQWAAQRLRTVNYVHKGSNPLTEMYSCLRADVVLEDDPSTQLNQALVDRLLQADRVLIGGQALSHCVAFTVRDLVSVWPPERVADLVVLTDASSPVPGFADSAEEFLRDMREAGVTLCGVSEAY